MFLHRKFHYNREKTLKQYLLGMGGEEIGLPDQMERGGVTYLARGVSGRVPTHLTGGRLEGRGRSTTLNNLPGQRSEVGMGPRRTWPKKHREIVENTESWKLVNLPIGKTEYYHPFRSLFVNKKETSLLLIQTIYLLKIYSQTWE